MIYLEIIIPEKLLITIFELLYLKPVRNEFLRITIINIMRGKHEGMSSSNEKIPREITILFFFLEKLRISVRYSRELRTRMTKAARDWHRRARITSQEDWRRS